MPFDREAALANLRHLAQMGWIGEYGFYEGGDYRDSKNASQRKPEPVIIRSWMAHHQGITLLALAEVLFDGAIHRWFHADPRVQACELLLHEKSLRPSAIIAIQNASNHCRHRKRVPTEANKEVRTEGSKGNKGDRDWGFRSVGL